MIRTGFILAQKKLLGTAGNIKFKWPRNERELRKISRQQLIWLLEGLEIEPKKYFKDIEIDKLKIAN